MSLLSDQIAAKLDTLPDKPGCYLLRDHRGRIIYVGKAVSLRKRVRSYFRPSALRRAPPKLRSLIRSVHDLDILVVRNEAEALLTEGRLIKEYRPRYNVSFRDDKQFLHIRVDLSDPFPKFELGRHKCRDGAHYFGPYVSSATARATVDFIEKRFGIRQCAPVIPDLSTHRHCLNDIVRYCWAPCLGVTTPETYRAQVEEACAFLEGRRPAILREVRERMQEAAQKLDFEQAAALRDAECHLRTAIRQRTTPASSPTLKREHALAGVRELGGALNLVRPPRVIEGFDVSNISGSYAVAAMVCFVDGRPRPQRYRRFRIRTLTGSNDPGMMAETIRRRFLKSDPNIPEPDLVLVDGGITQLRAAVRELRTLDMAHIPVAGLAKRHEELYTLAAAPLLLPRHSAALHVLQALRDEAHRFAIGYHRTLRQRALSTSILDGINGIGPAKKKTLLKHFGSVKRLRDARLADVEALPGIGHTLAAEIMARLSDHGLS